MCYPFSASQKGASTIFAKKKTIKKKNSSDLQFFPPFLIWPKKTSAAPKTGYSYQGLQPSISPYSGWLFLTPENSHLEPQSHGGLVCQMIFRISISHTIHGTGIFTYMNG